MSESASGNGVSRNLRLVGTRAARPDGVDKVTGRARFGADLFAANMLHGRVLRSPHAHARIVSIDVSKAERLPGVKAVVTRDYFPELPQELSPLGELIVNYHDMTRNVMAREKVLYEGHPVAAVAATSALLAKRALALIEVEYEVLPHVLDPVEAMSPDAPLLHDTLFTAGVEPAPEKPSNVAKRVQFGHGDVDAGFAAAEVTIDREYDTRPVHQGYIEPHACLASVSEDGQAELWVSTPRTFLGARALRPAPRMGHLADPGHRGGDRGRLRRQDGRVPGAACARALRQVLPAGEDDDDARGGLPGHRADLGGPPSGEDRRHP